MTNLQTASQQWATRPDDQRFLTLDDLKAHVDSRRAESFTVRTPVSDARVQVDEGKLGVAVFDRSTGFVRNLQPTNWSFGQLSQYAGAPAAYLRKLPPELTAINLQWGLEKSPVREEGLILGQGAETEVSTFRSLTSTSYGRIWDSQVVNAVQRANVGNVWQVPAASYTTTNPKRATTLYASDRDIFIFLVDPAHAIEVPGEAGQLFRGFFVWNSEVGAATFGLTTFLYRTVCDNRIVWGASNVSELRIRHTGGAPERFSYEGQRQLERYANEDTRALVDGIRKAQDFELPKGETEDKGDKGWASWLQKRGFTGSQAAAAVKAANAEEGQARSLWDIVNGITASARSIQHTDARVDLETRAGNLLRIAARN